MRDNIDAAAFLDGLPKTNWILGGRGYNADWLRDALKDRDKNLDTGRNYRKKPFKYGKPRLNGAIELKSYSAG